MTDDELYRQQPALDFERYSLLSSFPVGKHEAGKFKDQMSQNLIRVVLALAVLSSCAKTQHVTIRPPKIGEQFAYRFTSDHGATYDTLYGIRVEGSEQSKTSQDTVTFCIKNRSDRWSYYYALYPSERSFSYKSHDDFWMAISLDSTCVSLGLWSLSRHVARPLGPASFTDPNGKRRYCERVLISLQNLPDTTKSLATSELWFENGQPLPVRELTRFSDDTARQNLSEVLSLDPGLFPRPPHR
jgi:hypothetical protein